MGYFDTPDRGPRSNLLTQETSTPVRAPDWMLWKHRTANDAAAVKGRLALPKAAGLNCATFKTVNVNAVARDGVGLEDTPGGTATLMVTPYEWSDGDAAFVACSTASAAGPGGAGESVQLSFDSLGKIIYFHITGIGVDESASVYAQGFEPENWN